MTARMPAWMIVTIVALLVLAALFGLFAYSLTSSLGQGRPVATGDIVAIASPFVVVAICGGLAWTLWRAGQRSLATVLVWAPIPLFLVYLATLAI